MSLHEWEYVCSCCWSNARDSINLEIHYSSPLPFICFWVISHAKLQAIRKDLELFSNKKCYINAPGHTNLENCLMKCLRIHNSELMGIPTLHGYCRYVNRRLVMSKYGIINIMHIQKIDSSHRGAAYMRRCTRSPLVQKMDCRLFCAKSLTNPITHESHPKKQTAMNKLSNFTKLLLTNLHGINKKKNGVVAILPKEKWVNIEKPYVICYIFNWPHSSASD